MKTWMIFMTSSIIPPRSAGPAASLRISPDQVQFFRYDSITLSCNSSNWTVKRTIRDRSPEACRPGWAVRSDDSCIIEVAYPEDTGAYWCESERGESSGKVNITVSGNRQLFVNI